MEEKVVVVERQLHPFKKVAYDCVQTQVVLSHPKCKVLKN
jgi:hypothetical protein